MGGTAVKVTTLVLFGVILADIWANPGGVGAAANGVRSVETPALNAMLGHTS